MEAFFTLKNAARKSFVCQPPFLLFTRFNPFFSFPFFASSETSRYIFCLSGILALKLVYLYYAATISQSSPDFLSWKQSRIFVLFGAKFYIHEYIPFHPSFLYGQVHLDEEEERAEFLKFLPVLGYHSIFSPIQKPPFVVSWLSVWRGFVTYT